MDEQHRHRAKERKRRENLLWENLRRNHAWTAEIKRRKPFLANMGHAEPRHGVQCAWLTLVSLPKKFNIIKPKYLRRNGLGTQAEGKKKAYNNKQKRKRKRKEKTQAAALFSFPSSRLNTLSRPGSSFSPGLPQFG